LYIVSAHQVSKNVILAYNFNHNLNWISVDENDQIDNNNGKMKFAVDSSRLYWMKGNDNMMKIGYISNSGVVGMTKKINVDLAHMAGQKVLFLPDYVIFVNEHHTLN